jgi:hypothetical protein
MNGGKWGRQRRGEKPLFCGVRMGKNICRQTGKSYNIFDGQALYG